MGITSGIKGYRLWCSKTKKTIFSRDVTFNESAMLKKVNVEQLDGTTKKVEFERIIVPVHREIDHNSIFCLITCNDVYPVWVYTLKTNDEVLGVFIKWKKMMETQTCKKIKHLRTDNGREYKNDLFTKFCEEEGIIRHFIVRHTPQQNGVAEPMNRTLPEKVRFMLSNAGLGKEFCAEVVTYACHLVNRLPSTAIDGKTPFEKKSVG
uniref:Retrovirus-related Pol polyprotein from transposon TNT 1-94 n=1 Tax=Tanacetum cinerariifolium TaxID=118510 RepID=A0A699QA51_TANCI|nr:retrovirus-related Pol polyprotein from transposon TNT 1-94 [Tanacetum cinerariifolium]